MNVNKLKQLTNGVCVHFSQDGQKTLCGEYDTNLISTEAKVTCIACIKSILDYGKNIGQ